MTPNVDRKTRISRFRRAAPQSRIVAALIEQAERDQHADPAPVVIHHHPEPATCAVCGTLLCPVCERNRVPSTADAFVHVLERIAGKLAEPLHLPDDAPARDVLAAIDATRVEREFIDAVWAMDTHALRHELIRAPHQARLDTARALYFCRGAIADLQLGDDRRAGALEKLAESRQLLREALDQFETAVTP